MDPQDDKSTCLSIAKKIDEDVQHARQHRIWNTTLQVMLILMVATNFWRSVIISRSVKESVAMAKEAFAKSLQVRQRQDAYRQQYLDYIKDMIDAMQKFQDSNPSIQVPKAPVPRPLRSLEDKPNEVSLERIPQTKPQLPAATPTPIIKTKIITKTRRRPSPTPKPKTILNWFQKTR